MTKASNLCCKEHSFETSKVVDKPLKVYKIDICSFTNMYIHIVTYVCVCMHLYTYVYIIYTVWLEIFDFHDNTIVMATLLPSQSNA